MKDYLSNTERLSIISALKIAEKTEEFVNGNLFNAKEKADIKRSVTYMSKSILNMLKRLNPTAINMFNKAIKNTKVYVSSNSDIEIYQKRKSSDIESSYEENKEYFELVELIMYYNCKNCKKCGNECLFYKAFEENCIPEFEEADHLANCKYAYKELKHE